MSKKKDKPKFDPTVSTYDPSRPTVGKIYNDLHSKKNLEVVTIGDMSNSMLPGLVEDINEAIEAGTKEFDGKSFYILIHEKKDRQMPDALLRRMIKQTWRPYPEDDTTVFWHDPKGFETRFCWCLPHWSEMQNILMNENLFDREYVGILKAWRRNDLTFFGFAKDNLGNWVANPHFKDQPLKRRS